LFIFGPWIDELYAVGMNDTKCSAVPVAPTSTIGTSASRATTKSLNSGSDSGSGSGSIQFAPSDYIFVNRRSPVLSLHGSVACSQPPAADIGIQILKAGGNAVDAAVAVAAALQVTEPCSTGLGGDCFCLFYEAKTQKVFGLNGSGRCPSELTLERLASLAPKSGDLSSVPDCSVHFVTVPGACAGWCDAVDKWVCNARIMYVNLIRFVLIDRADCQCPPF
jgi:hypothetical protein